jgi:hypothetical protein
MELGRSGHALGSGPELPILNPGATQAERPLCMAGHPGGLGVPPPWMMDVAEHRPKVCRPNGPEEISLGQSASGAPGTETARCTGRRSVGPTGQRKSASGRAPAAPQERSPQGAQAEGLSAQRARGNQPGAERQRRPRNRDRKVHRPKVCRPNGPEEISLGQSASGAPGTETAPDGRLKVCRKPSHHARTGSCEPSACSLEDSMTRKTAIALPRAVVPCPSRAEGCPNSVIIPKPAATHWRARQRSRWAARRDPLGLQVVQAAVVGRRAT